LGETPKPRYDPDINAYRAALQYIQHFAFSYARFAFCNALSRFQQTGLQQNVASFAPTSTRFAQGCKAQLVGMSKKEGRRYGYKSFSRFY
jgi:hypothetical protein